MRKIFFIVLFLSVSLSLFAKDIKLPEPQLDSGKLLMQALKERHSQRKFSNKELSPQVLSNLLWAAFGINRPESGKHTAPSAMDLQEIVIYVALPEGLYIYLANKNSLKQISKKDIREVTGEQKFTQQAPVNLIYVAEYERMGRMEIQHKDFYSATDTGFISQNVYLYCASEGLATVVLGWIDREKLNKAMNLKADQKVILTQPVGYPEK